MSPSPAYSVDTELVNVDSHDEHNAASSPLYLSATYHLDNLDKSSPYMYSRFGNPTRSVVERHLAKVFGNSKYAFAVHSGMGALDVVSRLLAAGDEVIAGDDLYGGSNRLLTHLHQQLNIVTHHVDTTDLAAVQAKLNERTKIVLLESPTNPQFQICDIPAVCQAVKASKAGHRALVVVDNTMMSPINANPLTLGADIWYESGTKYLCGHHDIMAGVIALQNDELAEKLSDIIITSGASLAPFDSWLLLRGIKTLGVRFKQQQQNAVLVAKFLKKIGPQLQIPNFELLYPGDPSLKGYEVHKRTTRGPGSVLAIRTHDVALSEKIVQATKLFKVSVSFGAVNSLISLPCKMSHASIDPATRAARNFPEDIIRLCVGIEDANDLIADLRHAFESVGVLPARAKL